MRGNDQLVYDAVGSPDASFTGQRQDIDGATSGGQYSFPNRAQNPIQGRWWTPDPAGLAAVDPANPQSWNRYAYVNGDPLSNIDPSGLAPPTFIADSCAYGQWNGDSCEITKTNGNEVTTYEFADPGYLFCALESCSGGAPEMTIDGACGSYGCSMTSYTVSSAADNSGGGGGSAPAAPSAPTPPTPSQSWLSSLWSSVGNALDSCGGQALRKLALALDGAGDALAFLPAGELAVMGAQATVALASTIESAAHRDPTGALTGIAGVQTAPLAAATMDLTGSWAKAMPLVGVFFSVTATLNDLNHTYSDYRACVAGRP